ncbi:MAG: hypothetical protein KJ666_17005 [Bacteroidetes bacterium]|nr:hypothetical protein [Bacteroidota bacterium]MBU2584611.1 hypothetical protein [Bacteroidota bacterium]
MDTEASTETSNSRIKWWQLFLYPFTFHNLDYKSPFNQPAYTIVLPFIVFIFSTFISNYLLISNDYFVEQILLKAEEKAMERQDRDSALEVIDMTRAVLTNPGYQLLVSVTTTLVTLRNLVLFLFVCYLSMSFISGKWSFIKPFLLITASSINVLSIGYILNTLLKVSLLNESVVVGVALFLSNSSSEGILHFFINRIDLFTIWFLISLSMGIVFIYKEKTSFIFVLISLSWFLLFIVSFLLKFHFAFTF